MPVRHRRPNDSGAGSRRSAEGRHIRHEHHRPSGRHGGPSVTSIQRIGPTLHGGGITTASTHESYVALAPYQQAIRRVRRALSRHALEIVRECDIGARVWQHTSEQTRDCRVLYVTQRDLLALGIAADASVAMWLPLPLIVVSETEHTRIHFPVEAIVRDRASLLGLREPVHNFYAALLRALQTVAERDRPFEREFS
jgi:hypothetical protein